MPRRELSSWVFATAAFALWTGLILFPSTQLVLSAGLRHMWMDWAAGIGIVVVAVAGAFISALLHEWTHLVVLVGYPVRLRNDAQHWDLGVVLAKKTSVAKFIASALVPIGTGALVIALAVLLLPRASANVGLILCVVALSGVGLGLLAGAGGDFSQSARVVWLCRRSSSRHLQDDEDHCSHLV